jgi:Zn-dependent oligopeptidase
VKAKDELEELKTYFKINEIKFYDMAFYSRIFKEEKYEIDDKELKKYFEFENTVSYLYDFVKEFY